MGEDLEVELKVKNNSKEKRTIGVTLSLWTMYYNGSLAEKVEAQTFDLSLSGKKGIVSLSISEAVKLISYIRLWAKHSKSVY